MREAAARLANRDRLGRDVFGRGDPEPVEIVRRNEYSATLYDLLSAYARQRQYNAVAVVRVAPREVWSLQEAREALGRLVGQVADWTPLDALLTQYLVRPDMRRSVTASAFGASLELAREGRLELRQIEPFAPIYVRDRAPAALVSPEALNG
jgi:segregation and condensation protein A